MDMIEIGFVMFVLGMSTYLLTKNSGWRLWIRTWRTIFTSKEVMLKGALVALVMTMLIYTLSGYVPKDAGINFGKWGEVIISFIVVVVSPIYARIFGFEKYRETGQRFLFVYFMCITLAILFQLIYVSFIVAFGLTMSFFGLPELYWQWQYKNFRSKQVGEDQGLNILNAREHIIALRTESYFLFFLAFGGVLTLQNY